MRTAWVLIAVLMLAACGAPVSTGPNDGSGGPEESPEAKEMTVHLPEGTGDFDVVLQDTGDRAIAVIKEVRAATGLGLKDAKDLVDGVPSTICKGVDREQGQDVCRRLEEAGATAEVVPREQ